jgi:signal transduction histidine kinase
MNGRGGNLGYLKKGVREASVFRPLPTPVHAMDERTPSRQYRSVGRRRWLWVLLAVASAIYVFTSAWALSTESLDVNSVIWGLVMVPSLVVFGVFLMLKRPGHPIGELLALMGVVLFAVPTILEIWTVAAYRQSGALDWMWAPVWANQTLSNVGLVVAATLVVLLPDGHVRNPREGRFLRSAWIVVVFPTLVMLSNELMLTHEFSFRGVTGIPSPLFIDALEPYGPALDGLNTLAPFIFLAAVALLFMRYRGAATRERKQIRWVLFAGVMAIFLALIPTVLPELGVIPTFGHGSVVLAVLLVMTFILFPASVVVAVLEPPWIDVDIVIRRSLVYGALSVAILLVYIGVAASVGIAAGARLGLSVEVAVVLTVVIAILFQPARRRLQAVADRWVFGARPTKYEAVTEFGVTIEQAAEPTELLPRLVDTVRRVIRLQWAVAILDDGTQAEAGSVTGEPALRVPIGAGDEQIGEIVCGPKAEGALDDDEIQLVRTLAGQLGLAVMNARLAGRIVNAAESERRRIERNIHDGAQQELVALVARLGMARSAAVKGGLTPDVVDDFRREAQRILSDLRELAQGIHPSVLSDGGIVEAVEDRCARLPLEVSVESSDGMRAQRFGDDIEGAAYFFVIESLTNVLKHADATRAAVSLTHDDGRLVLEVADDGRGFNPEVASDRGLAGLRDRIRALGGTVSIASQPGIGTRISASLPVNGP